MPDILQVLRKPKVYEFNVPLAVYQDILWLEVPVKDVHVMELLDSQDDLGEVEAGIVLAQVNLVFYSEEELAARKVV